jgi:hypothetical protein
MNAAHDWEIHQGLGALSERRVNEGFRNRERTLGWLRRFRGDQFRMAQFRRLLAAAGDSCVHRFDDDAVLGLLASGIACGRFRWVGEEYIPRATAGGLAQESSSAPPQDPAPAPPAPRTPKSEPVFAEPTFPVDIDALAIAESQKEASRLGLPFCEECARKAAANALL